MHCIIYNYAMTKNFEQPKRPRGRPRKNPSISPSAQAKPMGRPAMGNDAKKINLTVRITPNEAASWRIAAKAKGLSLAEFILEPHRKNTHDNKT